MLTRILRLAALAAISASISLFAQGLTGSIAGSVADQSGSAVAGAEVTLTNTGTGQNRTLQSDPNGNFVFTTLLPNKYRLTVT